jgi:hypothetical protein
MPGIGKGMHPAILVLDGQHGIADLIRDHDAAQRQVAAGHSLGK